MTAKVDFDAALFRIWHLISVAYSPLSRILRVLSFPIKCICCPNASLLWKCYIMEVGGYYGEQNVVSVNDDRVALPLTKTWH